MLQMDKLILYRNLLQDNIVIKFKNFETNQDTQDAYELCSLLIQEAEKEGFYGNIWGEYLLNLIAKDENPFSRAAERYGSDINTSLREAAIHDIKILNEIIDKKIPELKIVDNYTPTGSLNNRKNDFYYRHLKKIKKYIREYSPEDTVGELAEFYNAVGCGKTGYYAAFRWIESFGLSGIENPDPVTLDDLIGYEKQKQFVVKNTEAFLNGYPANNLLLYGERGTGKSSTVKALVNHYYSRGLRLVEVPKHQLPFLPEILQELRARARHFIIFIDDLSFEDSETDYKYMKALMEGGIETSPENVLLYATSNRRHLIQENWNDREEKGEKHIMDAMQEKLSLSDRFGVTVTYLSPDQEEYLRIVENLANSKGIDLPGYKLRELALEWEKWYNTRSGRTAQQFINYLQGQYLT